jgi:proteasome assembly chaperone (PAC2) family protein
MAGELSVARRPQLERPLMIAAFRGWNDGGQGASLATGYLAKLWDAKRFAEIDPETFFDFQATRPHVSLEAGLTRRIDWPSTIFYHGRPDGFDRDVVLLLGIEPNLRWRTFSNLVVEFMQELGIDFIVTLGALLADVPHTRPCPVSGSASDPELVERLGLSASRYEGPTGIVGVLHDACRRAGIASASLWAAVPHYVSLAPSPRAARSLCDRLAGVLGIDIDVSELAEAEESYVEQVSEAVAGDAETAAYVEELEQRADSLDLLEESGSIPSGEALAAEIARFLREREKNGGGERG